MSSAQLIQKAFMVLSNGTHGRLGFLAAASVVSYAYSSLVLRLLEHVGVSLLASPQIAVAIVAVCLLPQLPQARACWNDLSRWNTGCIGVSAAAEERKACGTALSTQDSKQQHCRRLRSFQVVQPPFTSSISCSYTCTSVRGPRRRFPRLSVELTPLPRLSLEFKPRSSRSRSSKQATCDDHNSFVSGMDEASYGSSTSSDRGSSRSMGRWEPSMMRISSGKDLQLLEYATSEISALAEHHPSSEAKSSDAGAISAVGEALEAAERCILAQEMQPLDKIITRTHLLQFGAMLGEASSRSALAAEEAGGPVNHPSSFYGSADTDEFQQPWHLIVSESSANVLYWAWRRPLRKGLYMYMARTVFLQASPAELRAFMNDDAYRLVWDSSMQVLRRVEPSPSNGSSSRKGDTNAAVKAMAAAMAARSSGCSPSNGSESAGAVLPPGLTSGSSDCVHDKGSANTNSSYSVLPHENGIMQAMVQFPRPMASRSYVYARRVWHRPSDGGCYCLAKSCKYPNTPALPGKAVPVDDYASGSVVRAPAKDLLPAGYTGPAAELMLVYFEDSHVRPGLANMGVKKGLWPLVQRTEKALRVYQAGAAANVHLQSEVSARRLQRSYSTPIPGGFDRQNQHLFSSNGGSVSSGSNCGEETGDVFPASAALTAAETVVGCDEAIVENSSTSCASKVKTAQTVRSSLPECKADTSSESEASAGTCSPSLRKDICCDDETPADDKGRQYWSWWSSMTSVVGSALKGSAQALAAASVALWHSHTRLALMVPTLEWRLLHWVLQHVPAPKQLLLGAGSGSSAGVSGSKALVNSHPIGDMAHPSMVCRLLQDAKISSCPSLLSVASHPLHMEEVEVWHKHQEFVAPCCQHSRAYHTCGTQGRPGCIMSRHEHHEPLLGSDWPSAAFTSAHILCGMDKHNSCCSSIITAAVNDDSASQCSSMCGTSSSCSCARCLSSYPASASDRCCSCTCGSSASRKGHNCSGGCVRVSGGGRRQRRVVVRLMQAAGLRLAHRLISAFKQPAATAAQG